MSYTEITQEQFEYVLSHLGKSGYTWKKLEEPKAKESIYMVSINDIHLKVFSSIVGGISRPIGNDAIRVVGWDMVSDRPMSASEGRVNRTDNWSENLKTRIQTVVSKVVEMKDAPKCPKCGGMMSKMKGKYGMFDGCLNYKNHVKFSNFEVSCSKHKNLGKVNKVVIEKDKEFWE
ncbi:MAG: hypothetical protein ABH873_01120 [Candidatus Firestonebacteria bacterium]